jgi:hypothetical protein
MSGRERGNDALWVKWGLNRRQFLRRFGLASGALTFSPLVIDRFASVTQAASTLTRVYRVKNGDCFQNTAKIWNLLGGPARYIRPTDVVVIKGNAQWPNQGYTHTGCIKGIIDGILAIPGFSGEVLICDNIQTVVAPGATGFDASVANRTHNWPDENWGTLAAAYQAAGKPVAVKSWVNGPWRNVVTPSFSEWNPADGEGWGREFFSYNGRPTFLSYPVFPSPLTPGRMIDLRRGVWEAGSYTGRRVQTIVMPTLNNHGDTVEDICGVTSAVKSFFGATEIPGGPPGLFNGNYHIHSSSFTQNSPTAAGELVGRYLNHLVTPRLYVTAAMWSGSQSRTGGAVETRTVLACENPVSLDYVSCRDVISPHASWLNPDADNHTRQQLMGCSSQGIGTLDPRSIEVIAYDFNHPTTTRLDIERKISEFKAGAATGQDVKDAIRQYMEGQ